LNFVALSGKNVKPTKINNLCVLMARHKWLQGFYLEIARWNPNLWIPGSLFHSSRKLLDCIFWEVARTAQPKSSINNKSGSIDIFTFEI
jgi:hypothetical protein